MPEEHFLKINLSHAFWLGRKQLENLLLYPPPARSGENFREMSPGMAGIRRGSLPGKLRGTEVDKEPSAFNFNESR
jgi:hypothetical protein